MEYLFLDNYEEAKLHFMKCIDLDLEDYSSLYNIIYCFEFLDQTEKAIEYLIKVFLIKSILRKLHGTN